MMITACILLFFLLGIIFSLGKGHFLIAGFNTMPKEEKEKYDVVALCKFMGQMCFALAFSMTFWLVGEIWTIPFLFWIGLVLFITITIFMLIYMNTNKRFKK